MTETSIDASGTAGHAEQSAGADSSWPPLRQAYAAAWILAIVQMCALFNNGVMTLLVESVKRDLHLSDMQMSYLLGFSVVLFYAFVGIPAARLVDRHNRKWLMTGSIALWSAATAACGLATTFWQFFAARFWIGTGESINGPLSYSLLADYFPPEKLPRGIAIYNAGMQGGAALSLMFGAAMLQFLAGMPPIVLPGIGALKDWQVVFIVTGLLGIPVGLLMMCVAEPKRRRFAANADPSAHRMVTLREVLAYLVAHRRLYGPMFLGLSLTSIHMMGLAGWTAAFYSRTYGWSPAQVGFYQGTLSLVLAVPGLLGAILLNDWFRKRGHADTNMRVMAIGLTIAMPFAILAPLMPSPWLALALFATGPAIMLIAAPSLNTALQIITPNAMRGQMTAIYLFLVLALSQGLGPTWMAFLTEHVFGEEKLLRYAIATSAAILFPATAISYWVGLKPYRERILEMRAAGAPV
ncbi:MAG: MFS transporter [Novosphingobium sp.]|nr:MFS transporter [Novosphingobium sp.]